MQQPLSDAAAAAEAANRLEQQRAAVKSAHSTRGGARAEERASDSSAAAFPSACCVVPRPAGHAATHAPVAASAASASDSSSGSKRTAAVMSAKTAAAAAGIPAAAAASTTGPNKENHTQMGHKAAAKPVSPPSLISAPPALLPAPSPQPAVVSSDLAHAAQLCSEELGGSEDPAERVATEAKRQRKARGELSQDPKDWTEQIARNQAAVKELNGALELQRQRNSDIERSLRRAQRLVAWAIAQAVRQVNNETQAQLLEGGGDDASTTAAASAAAVSSSSAAAAAVPASTHAEFTLYDREEEIFAAAIAAQDDPMALRTVPAQSSDPVLNMDQTWSWMSLQFRMDIDARHIMLRNAKAFNDSLTQELADACKWSDRVSESADRSVEAMSLSEPMRGEIKQRIQHKAEAMIAAVMEKEREEAEKEERSADAPTGGAAAAADSSSSAAAAEPAAETSAASSEAASKQQ